MTYEMFENLVKHLMVENDIDLVQNAYRLFDRRNKGFLDFDDFNRVPFCTHFSDFRIGDPLYLSKLWSITCSRAL